VDVEPGTILARRYIARLAFSNPDQIGVKQPDDGTRVLRSARLGYFEVGRLSRKVGSPKGKLSDPQSTFDHLRNDRLRYT
jgi:hypothetical protein